jgi:hypothetical protein
LRELIVSSRDRLPNPHARRWHRVGVEVNLGVDPRLRGDVFLHDGTAAHDGGENIADLMNDDAPFFPLRLAGKQGRETVLVAKAQVRTMTVPALGSDARVAIHRSTAVRLDVRVEIEDGTMVTGVVFAEMPPGRQRALDFFNAPGESFFVVVTDDDRDVLVNRARVRVVHDAR